MSSTLLRVALDVSAAVREQPTGVARYVRRLVEALGALPEAGPEHARFSLVHRFSRLKHWRYFVKPPAPHFRVKLFQEPFHPRFARAIAVFHGLDARLPGPWWRGPMVATIHDLHSIFGSQEFASAEFRKLKERRCVDLARRAAALAVVSETCKQDVLKTLEPDPAKIHVIHEAAGPEFHPRDELETAAARGKYDLPQEYFLYVGSLNRRKNVPAMVRAFLTAKKKAGSKSVLALTGRPGWGAEELRAEIQAAQPGEAVRFLGFVPDDDLAPLYSGALGLLFVTLYEGFGLPAVEAFACGCPTLLSSCGSLPEIAGADSENKPAALLVDPRDEPAIAEHIARLMEDASLREDLRRRGLIRATAFSWEQTARKHWQLYCKVGRTAET
jgi:glycosyltransferase involved in cell wall biosynthesis